jgi:Ubiquitin-conjugating enzyme
MIMCCRNAEEQPDLRLYRAWSLVTTSSLLLLPSSPAPQSTTAIIQDPHHALAMTSPLGRLTKEFENYHKDPNPALASLELVDDDLFHWTAVLRGPRGTPYEGGKWRIDIQVPNDYPIKPPTMRFLTSICHPNVHLKVRTPYLSGS